MRSLLAVVATGLVGVATLISIIDGEGDLVPFFGGLTILAAIIAATTREPFNGMRRMIATRLTFVWLLVAVFIGALLVLYQVAGGDGPRPEPQATYLGLTPTVYHLAAFFGGLALALLACFAPARWLGRARLPWPHERPMR